jgi:hypothetical protein
MLIDFLREREQNITYACKNRISIRKKQSFQSAFVVLTESLPTVEPEAIGWVESPYLHCTLQPEVLHSHEGDSHFVHLIQQGFSALFLICISGTQLKNLWGKSRREKKLSKAGM